MFKYMDTQEKIKRAAQRLVSIYRIAEKNLDDLSKIDANDLQDPGLFDMVNELSTLIYRKVGHHVAEIDNALDEIKPVNFVEMADHNLCEFLESING